jgi:hypothetical protein
MRTIVQIDIVESPYLSPATEAPATGELVMDEVERPAGIWLGFDEDGRAGSYRLAATSAFAHGQGHRQTFYEVRVMSPAAIEAEFLGSVGALV